MNELSELNQMTSMEIAEVTGKQHPHVMRDIRDEIEKLVSGGIEYQSKFGLVEYKDAKGEKRPYYILTKEGVLQLAARYDAVVRAKLIELAMKHEPKPQSIEDLIIMQAQSMKDLKSQVNTLQLTTQTIKDTVISTPDKWRDDINRMLNKIVKAVGNSKYRELKTESYKLLEERAHVDLNRRLNNQRYRMKIEGAAKSAIDKVNKMDIVESDPKLREIYSAIVKEYTIKFVA
ncbi:Phage regulatory protein, Rha-like protein [Ruminiclostridium papyrosolvens DSM 2782]|uniref:Phage regulatory protein, Rha-like protein n=1 Tax=Ruminiclostridium papyrosolvens DSM 2782 TaxID=588581 RepID=F1TEA3_9FIRM|nr:Rha family transcriptional regulator [Ruminiclostridium papyrosolvens]EGD47069.1 Phage regulatory protein, Rha-like protein [Ruminiclostridium papyrosolvens DSM 2782]WES36010.1 Rha family transcriptional regulator [Ruminiclostridium papyrosolvens DSM 2782]WES36108.1 Rha family transcriptional regulator [Ruminiclostridium papyrosolvens DSM 2782]